MKRLPTKKQIEELINKTTSEWVEVNYIKGRRFTSKVNGNSIFLPAAGERRGSSSFDNVGSYGYYWLSLLHYVDNDRALDLYFFGSGINWGSSIRCYSRPVRLVSDIPEPGFIDLGLSVYWSECNEGANKPEEYGNYYTWDEAMKLINNKNNYMKTGTLQIQIPEGHEVDLENSNLVEGKVMFKKK